VSDAGSLRIYLGAAPGVGKTFAMLNEGRRRRERGTDVVVGYVETHGRARTAAQVADLPIVARASLEHRGATFEEMDIDAVLARHPGVALVDELAHTNAPGSRNTKRWQDVQELLDAGIDVITTLNIQHLESLNDLVERITGVHQRETVPDQVVRVADQIEIVDMAPEALRRRLAHGNIYAPDKVDAALANYFRPGNLAALRELALLWVADRVDEGLQSYMQLHGIDAVWETRERVVVAITGAPGGEQLIRRAARIASRSKAELLAVHVRADDGLVATDDGTSERLEQCKALVADLDGTWHDLVHDHVAEALTQFAKRQQATQLIIGATRRSRVAELMQGSVVGAVLRNTEIDVHVIVTDEHTRAAARARGIRPRWTARSLTRRRVIAGWAITVLGLVLLTLLLVPLRTSYPLPGDLMAYLLLVVAAASVGGLGPGLTCAAGAAITTNWFFASPLHTLAVANASDVTSLVAFVVVGGVVATLVSIAARRRQEATRARAEATLLAEAAAGLVGDEDAVGSLLRYLCDAFGIDAAAVVRRGEPTGAPTIEAAYGSDPPRDPTTADHVIDLDPATYLAVRGPDLGADDLRVLTTFCAQLADARDRHQLRVDAANAEVLARTDALRTALLRAVSHDLRTPLASIKASVSSLLQSDVAWSATDTDAFLSTIDEETDRLDRLVGNLLDMSRLEAGVLHPSREPVDLDDAVGRALSSLSTHPAQILVDLADGLPAAMADPVLLERVVANVVDNARRHAGRSAITVTGGAIGDRVHLRVVDQGPGLRAADRSRVVEPFQRLGDRATGVGLGLAVATGFMDAMDGAVVLDDTPGGGLTVVLDLPAEPAHSHRTHI
jgi:two-component system sensor histidine kinase KdpD